jgi:hypothetical protein
MADPKFKKGDPVGIDRASAGGLIGRVLKVRRIKDGWVYDVHLPVQCCTEDVLSASGDTSPSPHSSVHKAPPPKPERVVKPPAKKPAKPEKKATKEPKKRSVFGRRRGDSDD